MIQPHALKRHFETRIEQPYIRTGVYKCFGIEEVDVVVIEQRRAVNVPKGQVRGKIAPSYCMLRPHRDICPFPGTEVSRSRCSPPVGFQLRFSAYAWQSQFLVVQPKLYQGTAS
jgi:hypothetical protein